jgi:hypothetical protein
MGYIKTDEVHYQNIAKKIREYSRTDDTFKPSEMSSAIFSVYDRGYTDGYDDAWFESYENGWTDGYDYSAYEYDSALVDMNNQLANITSGVAEGGKSYYDVFWDAYQENGERVQYPNAFYLWDAVCFKPKYPIRFGTNVSSNDTFSYSSITEILVDIIIEEGFNLNPAFYYCQQLHTITKIVISENSTIDNHAFDGCRSLTSIRFEGTLGQSINFQWSPLLDKASIENVFSVMSSSTSGKTVTFNNSAKEVAFTDSEWDALISTKTNWTIELV